MSATPTDLLRVLEKRVARMTSPSYMNPNGPQLALGEREGFLGVARLSIWVLVEFRTAVC